MIKNPYQEETEDNSYIEAQSIIDCTEMYLDGENKKLLYVGASCWRSFFLEVLFECNFTIDILEVFEENIECIKLKYNNKYNKLIHGDINNKDLVLFYDVVFWYHGPEHVKKEEFIKIDRFLSEKTKVIILGCPYNDDIQGEIYGNEHEQHLWKVTQKIFPFLVIKYINIPEKELLII